MDIPRPIPDQSTTAQNPPMKPQSKGPIKRKPRQTLEQLSAGLTGGKKMTTLEKVSSTQEIYQSRVWRLELIIL